MSPTIKIKYYPCKPLMVYNFLPLNNCLGFNFTASLSFDNLD